ncbi:hypothetical protein CFN78_02210 [Amycolatopsis antarctica]|uniref:Uncharacterized protein n=1 Tax=Amycolatopsis antarctica TaxID=1854586 RepID=A0A263D941_9PSEU|nr:hypothetical protein [Amycolatopsis antarctica]OZM75022.1 hypothetical protein CFN78_02210 [Amycolatopsis antarctica]
MTNPDKTMLAVLAACAVAVPLTLGLTLDWPFWLWTLLILVALALVLLQRRRLDARARYERDLAGRMMWQVPVPQPMAEPQPELEPEPVRFEQATVPTTELSSATADYRFVFSATVWWRPGPNTRRVTHADLARQAVHAIVHRAQEVAREETPQDYTRVRHRLNSVLGEFRVEPAGLVEAAAADVSLELTPEDRQRIELFTSTTKDVAVWECERAHEIEKRKYLAEDVLSDTGSAVVWWLAQDRHDVENTVAHIGPLAELTAAANNAAVPNLFQPYLGGSETHWTQQHESVATVEEPAGPAGQAAFTFTQPVSTRPVAEVAAEMMDLVGLKESSPERDQFAERIAQCLRAIGRMEDANGFAARFRTLERPVLPAEDTVPPESTHATDENPPAVHQHGVPDEDPWADGERRPGDDDPGAPAAAPV